MTLRMLPWSMAAVQDHSIYMMGHTCPEGLTAIKEIPAALKVPCMTVWPSGLRRWLQAPVRKGVGSNPTAVTCTSPG